MKGINKQYKIFDLSKKQPQVLLLGNGLFNKMSWKKFIEKLADKDIEPYCINDRFVVPNLILASVATNVKDDNCRHDRYLDAFKSYEYEDYPMLNKLLNAKFDAILTTNYTYEIEYEINKKYCNLTDNTKRKKFAKNTEEKYDKKYLIHTFNRLEKDGYANDIWHIHGEQRRKSSLILTHDEYARLMCQIINYNTAIGNEYENSYNNLRFMSWLDYFIMGDMYILGQGFDFSEFDLWWLLLRRLRENAKTGTVYFYEPEKEDNKYKLLALNALGVKTLSLNCRINESKNKNEQYADFYSKAIDDIVLRKKM